MERQRRVKFSVELRSGTARFRVGVRARGTGKASSLVEGGHPRGAVGVAFPTGPEGFHVRIHDLAA